jgi:hypothetical protein
MLFFALFLLKTLQTIDLIRKNLNKNRKGVFFKTVKKEELSLFFFG